MNTASEISPDPQDIEFFDEAVTIVQHIYLSHGSLQPLAMVQGIDEESGKTVTAYLEASDLDSDEAKSKFIATIQLAGAKLSSERSLVILESWALIDDSPEATRLMHEIHKRGGSIKEHPNHIEAVALVAESDAGTISQTFEINRHHPEMVELKAVTGRDFYPRGDPSKHFKGKLTGFHLPQEFRKTPKGAAYIEMLSHTFGMTLGPLPDGKQRTN